MPLAPRILVAVSSVKAIKHNLLPQTFLANQRTQLHLHLPLEVSVPTVSAFARQINSTYIFLQTLTTPTKVCLANLLNLRQQTHSVPGQVSLAKILNSNKIHLPRTHLDRVPASLDKTIRANRNQVTHVCHRSLSFDAQKLSCVSVRECESRPRCPRHGSRLVLVWFEQSLWG